ncbi:iron-sulfur cluster-binding domain-containing protein [Chitinophaga nivalis]|uniref:Iron-sulfur cluster-binding domain-containing protein n=1 Tax=Chitinophaga nivalis TaxID=2991709 RepID=A0ABT3IV13_9BACT|nr:iron-sulfur cluster-binding domain-containing protein [Chitinophaga nivalis]MCW3462801.1 iron-sulfur cluster-binding domain-containing protein [Chitinophaga nivalis]MCW3487509.1 iron-sulfur cluster-binding domain-containing protein [Chitinophaga nivalis]
MYISLRITDVIPETPGTRTYRLAPVDGTPVTYLAGQFLTFIIDLHGKEYRRSYSFSSTPGVDPYLSVTIREKENGEISRHILRTWQKGDIVTSLEPSGRFVFEAASEGPRDLFLLAAGSGITPVFSLLKHILQTEPGARVTLIYSNTSPERTIFYQQLQHLQQNHPQLHCIYLFSNDPDSHHVYRRLNNILLEMLVNEHLHHSKAAAQFFLCGPPDYMRTILLTLTFMGFTAEQLHKENFVVNTEVKIAKTTLPQDTSIKQVLIRYRQEEIRLQVPGNQSILSYALEHDVLLPYSCKGGVCGSCTAQCTSGKIWMPVNEVLTDRELAEGLILTCVGYPVSDEVTIEL